MVYDPFAVFPNTLGASSRKKKPLDPNSFYPDEIGIAVSDFPQEELKKRQIDLAPPKIDPVLPNATEYDPFAAFRQSAPRARDSQAQAAPSEPNLGVLGESFGIYSPEDQQAYLRREREAAQTQIAGAQDRVRNRRAMGMSPEDDLLGADEARQATLDIKQGQERLKQLSAMERGELALPVKSGLRSAVENFPRSVAETALSIPEMVGIIKGYVQEGPVDDEFLLNWSKDAKGWAARQFPGDPARQDDFTQQLATGAGSLVSFYGIGILARLAKLSRPAQAAIISAFGGTASGTQGFEEATRELEAARAEAARTGDKQAVDEYDRLLKTIGYTGVGFTEAIPIARTLTRAAPNPTTRLGQRIIQGAEGAAEEATQEAGAQLAQNVISQQTTDPARDTMAGVGESAQVGGTLGGLMNFLLPGRFSPDRPGGQDGGAGAAGPPPFPQLPPPDNWDWLDQGVEDRGPLTPLEDIPVGEPDQAASGAPLALPDLNAPERNALKAEMSRLLRANPSLSGQMDQFMEAVDQPGPTQNVVQAALQKVRDTGKLSSVANELIQAMRPAMAQAQPQTLQQPLPVDEDIEVQDQYAAPGTAGRVRTSPLQEQAPPQSQVQTQERDPFAMPEVLPSESVPEDEILPALGPSVPSRDIDELGYYSQALESARTLPQATGTPEQMLAQLEKGGTKEAEIRATDVDKFLFGAAIANQRRQLVDLRAEVNALRSELGQKDPEVTQQRRAEIEAELARIQPLLETGEDEFRQALQQSNLPRRINRDDLVDHLTQSRVGMRQSRYGGEEPDVPSLRESTRQWNEDGSYDIEIEDRVSGDQFIVNVDDDAGEIVIQGPGGQIIPLGNDTPPVGQQGEHHAIWVITEWLENKVTAPENVTGPAKWETYSLDPGNPTYRENVVALGETPREEAAAQQEARDQAEYNELLRKSDSRRMSGEDVDRFAALATKLKQRREQRQQQQQFKDAHWSEPNIIGHYRTQELQTTDGRTSLNGDEFQSGWGQRIREGGARDEAKIAELREQGKKIAGELQALDSDVRDFVKAHGTVRYARYAEALDRLELESPNAELRQEAKKLNKQWEKAASEEQRIQAELRTAEAATAAHPLVRSTDQWLTTTLRKFIKDAVDAGVDGVTITPGQMQIARYPSLATQGVTGLAYAPDATHGLGDLVIQQNNGRWFPIKQGIPAKELRDYIGRDLSEQLLKQEPEDTEFGYYAHVMRELPAMEIGGEGMRATYDVMYPRALGKLLQKMDKSIKPEKVKLLPHKISGSDNRGVYDQMIAEGRTFDDYPYNTIPDKQRQVVEQTFTFFPITDKVRQKVREEGQPLFALGPGDQDEGRSEPGRDRTRRTEDGSLAPLKGAPTVEGATGPDPRVVAVAEAYARQNGITLKRQAEYARINPELAARIATAYDQMPHAPTDPKVAAAYQAMIDQTKAQYQALADAGYKFWFYDENNDPYQGNPWNAIRDLRQNQSMAVFATEAGFGSGATDVDTSTSPLLVDSGISWPYGSPDGPMKRVLVNDMFRAVHDVFGHSMEGAGFRARGEENAWQAHIRLYTGLAQGAMTSETRGQNSWLNFGPYGERNRTASLEDTVFGDQKSGLMPEWTWAEGRVGDQEDAPFADIPTYALEDNPQAAMEALRIGSAILQDWINTLAQFSPEGAGPGPDAAIAAVSAISQSGQRTMAAMRQALTEAGFPENIPDEIVSQGLLSANFLMAPETRESVDPLFAVASSYIPPSELRTPTERVVYHGTGAEFERFDPIYFGQRTEFRDPGTPPTRTSEKAFIFTDDPKLANNYADNITAVPYELREAAIKAGFDQEKFQYDYRKVQPVIDKLEEEYFVSGGRVFKSIIETKNFKTIDMSGYKWSKDEGKRLRSEIRKAKKEGKSGLIVKGMEDSGGSTATQYAVWDEGTVRSALSESPLFAIASFPLSGNAGRMTVLQRQQSDIFNQIDTLTGEIHDLIDGKANDLTPEEEVAYRDLASQVDALNERLPEIEQELNDLYDKQHDARAQSGLFEKRSELMDKARQARHEKSDRETEIAELEKTLDANPNDFQTRRQLQLTQQRLADVTARAEDAQAELDKIQDDLSNLVFALRGFYSPAIRAVEKAKQDKATPEQWKKVLQGPGVRQEEVRWLHVMDWLDEQASMMVDRPGSNLLKSEKTIAKPDLIDFMRAHQYEIEQRVLLSERDPDGIPEDEREDEDDEPEGMSEEERDEWIDERSDEIFQQLQRDSIDQYMRDWRTTNDPDDYEIEISFEEYDTGDEQLLLEVERVYAHERQLYDQTLADVLTDDGSQFVLPGVERPPLVAPTFEAVAKRVLPEETFENWKDGHLGWVAQLTHAYDLEDEDINDGDVFNTRAEAQAAAEERLAELRARADRDEEFVEQDYVENNDFAYEYDQARQQAHEDFVHEHGDGGVRRSGNYFSDQTRYKNYRIKGGRHYQEMIIRLPMLEGKYSSHHYQDQEVVHIRYDVREGPNGERVLFIHEIQSDLHQRARGFGTGQAGLDRAIKVHNEGGWTPELLEAKTAADRRVQELDDERLRLLNTYRDVMDAEVQMVMRDLQAAQIKTMEVTERAAANRSAASTYIETFSRFSGAPEAPFTGTAWWELGFKAALQRAVEKGFDGVALTTPAQIREATYTPEKVAQKFYGENVPKFISKYVKKWGAKPERKALSGVGTESRIGLRDNYTKNDFIAWLNGSKNLAAMNTQDLGLSEPGWTTTEADKLLTAVTSPQFDGDLLALINASSPAMKTTARHDIPSLWRAPDGKLYLAPREGWTHYPSVPSPLVTRQLPIQNLYWPITDAMRKDLSGEGTGQPLAIGQEQILRGIDTILAMGRSVTIGDNVKDAIFNAIAPHRAMVPSGLKIGYLSRIEPVKGRKDRVNAYFTTEDGSSHVMEYDQVGLLGLRAFYQPPNGALPPGLFFLRTTTQGEFQRGIIGEIRHEAIHALRRGGRLPDSVWSALVGHAKQLQVMDISFADYLNVIGRPTQDTRAHAVSVGDQYRSFYSGRSDFQEVFDQESVAHLAELYSHDAWTQEEIAPVKAMLDDIFAGRYSGTSPDPRGGGQDPAFALRPIDREGQPIKDDPKFKAWFKNSAVKDELNEPKIVYHATLADVSTFDPRRTKISSNLGKGFYFTDSTEDAGANYGHLGGPDIQIRVTDLAERINDEAGLEYNDPHGLAMAREQMGYVHEGMSMPVYLSMQHPVVISEPFSGIESTFFPYESGEVFDPETDEYEQGEPSGELVEFFEALRQVAPDYDNINIEKFIADLMDDVFINEGMTADQIYTMASHSENLIYGEEPETGELSGMEPIRRAYEMMGYDGIIDHTVDEKFSTMQGIQGATHYVVFRPEQIKSVFNAGGFDPKDPDILAAIGGKDQGRGTQRSQTAKKILSSVKNGRSVTIPNDFGKTVFDAIRPHRDMVPDGYIVANLSKMEPVPGEPDNALFTFTTEQGQEITQKLPSWWLEAGAALHFTFPELPNRPATPGIVFINFASRPGSKEYFRGKIRHESVHALWERLPPVLKRRLLSHAKTLSVMDNSMGSYFEAIGEAEASNLTPGHYEQSLGEVYHELYKKYPDIYQDYMDQEHVAHMAELYEHGVFTPQEIAPVKHILDAMFRGDFSRGSPEQARALEIAEPAYQIPETIANLLRKEVNAAERTLPARNRLGQPVLAQAGAGASQGVSPADRITPGREDFERSSLIGESLGRRPIHDILRHEAVRAYLGDWWKPNAALKRARLQGFTLPAWHATRSDFLIPNPNVPTRDFGFHVAINTPNAANERAGFSEQEIAEQRKWQAVVPEAISNMVGFWSDRRRTRNLPLLVKARNPLRVPDLNAWGSMPMWRGFITDLFAGRVHDIDYMKTHKVFKEIYAMTESVMQEKAMGDPGFDADQTFRQLLVNILENHGYDSIIYQNDYEDKGNDSLFLWDATRVRSAFDTFDPRANGNPGLYASVPFMEADLRQELNRALREEGLEEVVPTFAIGESITDPSKTSKRPITELYTDYLKTTQKSGKKPISFKEFAQR